MASRSGWLCRADADKPLTPYDRPRILEEWDGFAYQLVGATDDLAVAREWVNELRTGDDPAA
ncbi:hypothetical protein [Streptomyces sp. NBC_00986]|uniref:hypothetical protein n=1 Tax=Streptomyces sp. NBC_00986 TaxID=2903702 RepID=UPI00386F0EAD|nr:hypothetical protein OG504_28955 [Streptomyces sp. NBC_00986]